MTSMKQRCKGFCELLPHLKSPRYFSKNKYYNYCVECEKSFEDRPGLYVIDKIGRKCCPCCGLVLRVKRRYTHRPKERVVFNRGSFAEE